jgi:uncharacterized membrane protein
MAFGLDPETTKYFKKITRSLFTGLMWLFINVTAGIYYGLGFPEHFSRIVNILFYAWLAISLVLMLWYLSRLWRR